MAIERRWAGSLRGTLAVILIVAGATAPIQGEDRAAGRVKVASGTAWVIRGSDVVPASVGQVVFGSDILRTGSDGRLGVTLDDSTRISLGADTELRVERFDFSPAEGRLSLVVEIARGLVAYVSGQIAKLAPDAVRLETPAATVGVRGTTLVFRVTPE